MNSPLSERLRPTSLDHLFGQEQLLAPDGLLKKLIAQKKPLSILLWGPPGCGKTTLAKLYAKSFDAKFISFSAVFHGTADLKKAIQETQDHPLLHQQIILFIDEIHRFNKAQQDIFLPFLEDGTIILVGATTENPSFALNNALLSRLRVLTLKPLDQNALEQILCRYESLHLPLHLSEQARLYLIQAAQGDGRHLINLIENLHHLNPDRSPLDIEKLQQLLQRRSPLYDRGEDSHYNLISALHKSIRGSDPQAALYWLARMLQGGEDPQFICRRLIRMAAEDIGLADPEALGMMLHVWQSYQQLGAPEGELMLAQAVVYLALSPKSNALYLAFKGAQKAAQSTSYLSPPKAILNAPTKLMWESGYSEGYQYDHDTPHCFSGQNYFPDEMTREEFYQPVDRGYEREMKKRIAYFAKLREERG